MGNQLLLKYVQRLVSIGRACLKGKLYPCLSESLLEITSQKISLVW